MSLISGFSRFFMIKIFFRFYSFLAHYKKWWVMFWMALILFSLTEIGQPYFMKLFVDLIPSKNMGALIGVLVAFLIFRLVRIGLETATYWFGDQVMIPASTDARMEVVKKIQDLDFAYHAKRSTGSLISVVRRGDSAFDTLFHSLNIRVAGIFVSLLTGIAFFSVVAWWVAAILLVTFFVNLALTVVLIKHNIKQRKRFNDAEDEISGIIVDNMINFETVKLFAKEEWERKRLSGSFVGWMKSLWGYANSFRLFDIGIGIPANIGLALILWIGIRETMAGRMGVGDFVLIVSFMNGFYWRFFDLLFSFRDIAKSYADIVNYLSILDLTVEIKDPVSPMKKLTADGEIEFNQVGFNYPEGKGRALNNFNLKIRQGESVALVGRSGAGKTTIVKLLLRFYDVNKGGITIDGVDIRMLSKERLRQLMGVVPQEPILFNNTVGYNIGYGKDRAAMQEIRAAAKMANIDDFIMKLPKKYETNVGERGIKLSGGQKQRLAIARMILSDPDIVIFDEATSNLDSESERKIQDAFWKFAQNKTSIVIAHRLSTVMRADKIVVLDKGKIVEMGSHRALLSKPESLYSKFWSLQLQKQEE